MNQEETLLHKFGYKQELTRTFGVWQLTAFGLNYMIPIAPAIIFGFILKASGGSVALPYLLALMGMLFTAFGYAYFIKRYPLAGSLFSYVSKGINTHVGFIAGWSILLDYMVIPTLTAMSASDFLHDLIPVIPYELILIAFIGTTGLLNLMGSRPLARLGLLFLVLGEIVIFIGFFLWSYAVAVHHVGVGHLISAEPFHFKSFGALTSAASIAMLSYLGFDAITTLAEESKAPRRDIPRAIFISLIIGSFTMFLTGYLAMLVIPHWHEYIHSTNWLNTTLFFVNNKTGGEPLVLFYTIGFVVAMGVFNVVATAGASRLLYGMSRDGTIPLSFLHYVGKKNHVPTYGIILIVAIQLLVGSIYNLDILSQVVNFGALGGFVLLNIAVFSHIIRFKTFQHSRFLILIVPIVGAVLNFWIFSHLDTTALWVGACWIIIGLTLYSFHYALQRKRRTITLENT